MSFATAKEWPRGLLKIFEICREERVSPPESRYYGPYSTLLTYCFNPSSFEFFVARREPVDFVVFDAKCRPVLIAQVKDDCWATSASLRSKADKQMRDSYDAMLNECPLPRLWGLSLLGTSLRVYSGDIASGYVEPAFKIAQSLAAPSLPVFSREAGISIFLLKTALIKSKTSSRISLTICSDVVRSLLSELLLEMHNCNSSSNIHRRQSACPDGNHFDGPSN